MAKKPKALRTFHVALAVYDVVASRGVDGIVGVLPVFGSRADADRYSNGRYEIRTIEEIRPVSGKSKRSKR